jgi:biotin-dependent carboxylase-like uncharacterized protein
MSTPALEILEAPAASIQDAGRKGWRSFGVPSSGAMDQESLRQANRLVGNRDESPVLEIAFGRAIFRALASVTIALTGADASASHPLWRTLRLTPGESVHLRGAKSGLWCYVALEGEMDAPSFLGSASVYQRAGIGRMLRPGDIIRRSCDFRTNTIAGRFLSPEAIPDWRHPANIEIWPGPEWEAFPESSRTRLLEGDWEVSAQSDRTGYRLQGASLRGGPPGILSGPVLTGTIQVPPSGQPIILMRDGPTVGGYARLASVSPPDLDRLAQCAPGTRFQFQLGSP